MKSPANKGEKSNIKNWSFQIRIHSQLFWKVFYEESVFHP